MAFSVGETTGSWAFGRLSILEPLRVVHGGPTEVTKPFMHASRRTGTAIERVKWTQEVKWRNEEIELRRAELKRSRIAIWVPVVASVIAIWGSVVAALIVSNSATESARENADRAAASARESAAVSSESARDSAIRSASSAQDSAQRSAEAIRKSAETSAESARLSLERRWHLEQKEDQRKAIVALTDEYIAALLRAFDLAEELTAKGRRQTLPTPETIEAYDRRQRANLITVAIANGKILRESPRVAYAFVGVREWFRKLDDDIMLLGQSSTGYSDRARRHAWCRLNVRMRRLNLAAIIDEVRVAQVRPGVSEPSTRKPAPPMTVIALAKQLESDSMEEERQCGPEGRMPS